MSKWLAAQSFIKKHVNWRLNSVFVKMKSEYFTSVTVQRRDFFWTYSPMIYEFCILFYTCQYRLQN